MRIGIPKEIKQGENHVGMTPAGVTELIRHGHEVSVQFTYFQFASNRELTDAIIKVAASGDKKKKCQQGKP